MALKIPPPLVLLFFIFMAWLTREATSLYIHLGDLGKHASTALYILGGLIAAIGVLSFRRASTTINPHTPHKTSSLVSTGIYAYTRNPMYLGMVVILLGTVVQMSSTPSIMVLPLFIWYITMFQIKPEEAAMEKLFGGEFLAYKQTVRRWV